MTDTDSDTTKGGLVSDQHFGDLSYPTDQLRAMLRAERELTGGNSDMARMMEAELKRRGVAQ